jgi:hypothetical protein
MKQKLKSKKDTVEDLKFLNKVHTAVADVEEAEKTRKRKAGKK